MRWPVVGVAAVVLVALVLANIAVAAAVTTSGTVRALEKKLIEYGWDVPFPDYLRHNERRMEKRPFDGVIFKLHDGCKVLDPKPWNPKALAQDLKDLRAMRFRRFTDNFIIMWAASNQDWFDDAQWSIILAKARQLAACARLGRCKGVCFDPEPYGPDPWNYSKAAHKDTKSFAEYELMARHRGRQFMGALRSEFPNLHVMTLFQLSVLAGYMQPMDPAERASKLASHHYGLLPAFLEGMIEAAGDQVIITDGNEGAYYYTDSRQHFEVYHRITQKALTLIDPALWDRYRSQVRVGQALYIDQYFGLRTRKVLGHYMTPEERARWFEHNVYWSLYTTDKYVWCYSERMNWWKDQGVPPGCEEAIRSAREKLKEGKPLGFDMREIVEKAKARQRAEIESRIKKRTAEIHRLPPGTTPPVVDGQLDDVAWKKTAPLAPFVLLASYDGSPTAATRAWVTYDDRALYVAWRCEEPAVDRLQCVGVRRDDPLWQGDDVELLVSVPGATAPFYHFMVNPQGLIWDGRGDGEQTDTNYNPRWQAAAQVGKDYWSAEMAVPWEAMNMKPPSPGSSLRANLCRQRLPRRELSCWSSMVSGFLEHELFGTWVFR